MIWLVVAPILVILLLFGLDVYRHRHPLTAEEVVRLAEKRRRDQALREYEFSMMQRPAAPAEKKAMKRNGEFVDCDLAYAVAPSTIAGLLKYKKHEWIVVAFVRDNRVMRLWWNKGPDGTCVWSFLDNQDLARAIRTLRPNAIAILHNHPNSDPSRYRVNAPSMADLTSADHYWRSLRSREVSLLEFICERGMPHLFYAGFADAVAPVGPIVSEIRSVNGTGVFCNYRLRRELKSRTRAEQVHGPSSLPPVR